MIAFLFGVVINLKITDIDKCRQADFLISLTTKFFLVFFVETAEYKKFIDAFFNFFRFGVWERQEVKGLIETHWRWIKNKTVLTNDCF